MSPHRVAFIGLGHMGRPMARNLHAAGHPVTAFDLSDAARAEAQSDGLAVAGSLEDALRDAEVMLTMLPAGKHVLSVWREALPQLKPGTLLIDCSTIDTVSASAAHDLARDAGFASLDAPVSGGTKGADAGTLTFMAGGEPEAFARARPLLEAMGARIVHCGAAGAGQAAKICNNMILGVSMIAVAEAFVLAERLGLSAQALFDVASTSSGQCWSLTSYCPVPGPVPASPANNDYRPGFAASLMLKDLGLARDAAQASGATTPLGQHAHAIYEAFVDAGGGEADFSAIIRRLREGGTAVG